MSARFTVLASGSSGNASLLQSGGFGVLLDFGIGPRVLTKRLATRRLAWSNIHAAVLTHTHSDHWNEATLAQFHRLRIPLFCHASHADALARQSDQFSQLVSAGLVHLFQPGRALTLDRECHAIPFRLSHDCDETFGLRLEGGTSLFGPSWTLGYAADLGCWNDELVESLAAVDLLALEFNHDEQMQIESGRPAALIERVLGDCGHLSNRQAHDLLIAVLNASPPNSIQHVVTLHMSRECNHSELALAAATSAVSNAESPADVFVAPAFKPLPTLAIGPDVRRSARLPRRQTSAVNRAAI